MRQTARRLAIRRLDGQTVSTAVLIWISLAVYPSSRLATQSLWRPSERVVISDFSHILAVAASPSLVFAATTHGLTLYDRITRRWRLPVTKIDGYPAAVVRVALADPVGDAVWLGTDQGWAHYDVEARVWEGGPAAGGVNGLMLDAQDPAGGVFLGRAGGWAFLPRGAFTPIAQPLPPPGRRIVPLAPQAALNMAPAADALRALFLTDPRLRAYAFTSAARTPDRSDLFFGTNGMGVIRIDASTGQWEPLRFGLLAPAAGALALDHDDIWVATRAQQGERSGLTLLDNDLTTDSTLEGAATAVSSCRSGHKVIAVGEFLWVACDRGLLRIAEGERGRMFDIGRGLPSDQVLSLAPAPEGVWAGTARGLALITEGDQAEGVGSFGRPVLSLLRSADTLWVGTVDGLAFILPGDDELSIPLDVTAEPWLRTPIVAIALAGDRLVAVTPDQFAWRDPKSGTWSLTHARSDLGAIAAAAGDPDGAGVWLGGAGGVAFWDLRRGTFRVLYVPNDVPAPVRDLVADDDYLWVATDSGLVRFSRRVAREGG